jgi:hypothetical protein
VAGSRRGLTPRATHGPSRASWAVSSRSFRKATMGATPVPGPTKISGLSGSSEALGSEFHAQAVMQPEQHSPLHPALPSE